MSAPGTLALATRGLRKTDGKRHALDGLELTVPAGVRVPEAAACVVMTHSFDQDLAALAALGPLPIAYLGLLGPRARRNALLERLGSSDFACKTGLHNPVGLDIGSRAPEEIALSILAEVNAALAGRAGGSLSDRSG